MSTIDFDDTVINGSAEPALSALLAGIVAKPNVNAELGRHFAAAREVLLREHNADSPFLTVLMRTQAHRIEAMKDALLCLSAQSDSDFEVILLSHDVDESQREELATIVNHQPDSFRNRIRIVDVVGGGRARPLNVGVDAARGSYIAVFDDDDLVFAHWVEQFHHAIELAPGKLLRALVATQQVKPEFWSLGGTGFKATTWPTAEYSRRFDLGDHLVVNHSPFMSWAFPASLFNTLGLRFDEQLAVCEDWDVILQGSLMMGVEEVDELTSIYRRWTGVASSYSVHSTDEWAQSEKRVIDRLNRMAHVMPVGVVAQLRKRASLSETEASAKLNEIYQSNSWRLILRLRQVKAVARGSAGRVLRFFHLR